MPFPTINALPSPPDRGMDAAAFAAAADLFLDAFPGLVTDLNAFATAMVNYALQTFKVTSATNLAIGTGAKTFAAQVGAVFQPGHFAVATSRGTPANFMIGQVTAYNAGTGSLTISVTNTSGAGSFSDWDITLTVGQGASLDSPAFTGLPTAPTAVVGTNTTQLATTAYVRAAVAALVNSAPGTLDQLNELATAIGNDPNFAVTIAAQFAALGAMSTRAKAVVAELFAWTADKGLTADVVGGAFAQQALAYATTLAWDWQGGFYRGQVSCTGNVTIATPTNIRAGETRIIGLQGNDATARTVSFSSAYKGALPVITDMTSTKPYRLVIFADTGANLSVDAKALV